MHILISKSDKNEQINFPHCAHKTSMHGFPYRRLICFWTLVYQCFVMIYFHSYLIRTQPNRRMSDNKTLNQWRHPLPQQLLQPQRMNLRPNIETDWDSNLPMLELLYFKNSKQEVVSLYFSMRPQIKKPSTYIELSIYSTILYISMYQKNVVILLICYSIGQIS